MSEKIRNDRQERGPLLHAALVFLLYAYFLLWPVNFYLAQSLAVHYYPAAVAALAALYYARRRPGERLEVRLYGLYCLWFFLTRVLNGDVALLQEFPLAIGQLLCCMTLAAGPQLSARGRERLLLCTAALLGAFGFALGCCGIAAALLDVSIRNPITDSFIAGLGIYSGLKRLGVLDTNPNISAMWFFLSLCMLAWLFACCGGKKRLWRVPVVLAAAAVFTALALTYSRNVKILCAACVGMLVVLAVLRLLRGRSKALLALVLVLAVAVAVPASYLSFQAATEVIARAAVQRPAAETAQPAGTDGAEADEAPAARTGSFSDHRAWNQDSGRLQIFRSAFTTLQRDPLRLLRGCLSKDEMSIANTVLSKTKAHFHNTYLQILVLTGLPGFLLMAAICALLAWKSLRLFFTAAAPMTLRLLALPLLGSLVYNLLEVDLFMETDMRTLTFFLLAGILLGGAYELWPPRRK
ncbi:MAG: O-antigen ligase family protein [Oscillospiraceae bacterium]|nr:O-antigen ligase family protein [Oscillospiraceae bacterium]